MKKYMGYIEFVKVKLTLRGQFCIINAIKLQIKEEKRCP